MARLYGNDSNRRWKQSDDIQASFEKITQFHIVFELLLHFLDNGFSYFRIFFWFFDVFII